jgi:hypothetical protein
MNGLCTRTTICCPAGAWALSGQLEILILCARINYNP